MLNDTAIRATKPGSILWDSSLKGFGIRAGTQSKTFIVLVASGRRKKIGRYPLISLADARSIARKILAEKTLGKIVPKHTAYEDAKEDFLKDCATRIRLSTLYLYSNHLKQHFKFARRSLGDIAPRDILRTLKDLKPSQKAHAFRVGRTFFSWCLKQHLIDRSPMENLDVPPHGKPRERVLTDEELAKVYKTALKATSPIHRLIYLLIHTGQRLGETRRLKWSYILPDRITLPGEITKNGRPHTFPIAEETHRTISAFPRLDEYLFPAGRSHVRGKPVQVWANTVKPFADFKTECELSGWTLHDLRRTFATNLQRLSVRLELTEALLNHVSGTRSGIVGVYQRHSYFSEMQDAIALWENKLHTLSAEA